MKNTTKIFIILIISLLNFNLYAQTISLDLPVFNEYYRRAQLLGEIKNTSSFSNRPLFIESIYGTNIFHPDTSLTKKGQSTFNGVLKFGREKGIIQFLPIQILNQFNSHHPEGFNDGSMIPTKGFQTQISAGIFLKYGPFSIQLRPEFVYAQNLSFDGFPSNYTSSIGITFPASQYNGIDLPEKFGDGNYQKTFWGQSAVRLKIGPVSIGLSNENLWWGPGYRNSLLMTNSAPGFKHFTLNTVRPIKTPIGSFEGQMINGKLEESGFVNNLQEDWVYINAMVLSYQPKWFPGLHLGVSRSFLIYRNSMGTGLGDYFPVISFLSKKSSGGNEVDTYGHDQLLSVFMRWILTESHGEIYFEYGREDHAWDLTDFILEPAHSTAYIIGLRKLFPLNPQKSTYWQLILEASSLASPQTTINRNHGNAGMWYTHGQVRHGYTNQGQVLGAGIGPGGKLQTLDVSWVQSFKQIGIQLERTVHNADFWYNQIRDIRSNWVDISAMAYGSWDYKKLIFTLKLKCIESFNYQWLYEPDQTLDLEFWLPSENTFNFHGQLGIVYRF